MALTTEATTRLASAQTPSGWTNPATTITFTSPITEPFETTIAAAGVTDAASETTGLTNLVAAVKTWVDGTWIPNILKLETTVNDVDGILTITKVERHNGEASDTAKLFLTGTDGFKVYGSLQYE